MGKLTTLLAILLLSSCGMTKKAANRKLANIQHDQPGVLENYCGDEYPPLILPGEPEYIKGDTKYLPGKQVYFYDTTIKDSILLQVDTVVRVDTFKQTDTVENTAKIRGLNTTLKDKDEKIAVCKSKIKSKNKWILYMGITLGTIAVISVVSIILKIKSGSWLNLKKDN